MTVAVRRHKQSSMVAAAALSNLLGSLVSIPFADGLTDVTDRDLMELWQDLIEQAVDYRGIAPHEQLQPFC